MITKIEIEPANNGYIIEVEKRERKKGGVGANMTYEPPLKSEISHVATKKSQVLKHISGLLDKMSSDADNDGDSKKDNDNDND